MTQLTTREAIASKNNGNAAAVFSLRERIIGSKKGNQGAVVIVDPETGSEVNSVSEIKEVTLNYCCNLLTNRPPKVEYEEEFNLKNDLHEIRMIESEPTDCFDLFEEIFDTTYKSLEKRPGGKYNFIMKAGISMKPALYNICKTVWQTEQLPKQWSDSTLVQLYKGKGAENDLRNQRFIHMKDEFSKFFGNMLMAATKNTLVNNMTKFQIGTKPGHRTQEHLFSLKCVISIYYLYDKPLILSTFDISKFFMMINKIYPEIGRSVYILAKQSLIRQCSSITSSG